MSYDMQMEMHVDEHIWPEWGGRVRGDMIKPHWAHPGEDMGTVIGLDPATGKDRVYTIIRCAWCICTHVWPLPAPEALAHYYAQTFYEHDKPDYIARYERDREWWEQCVHGPLLAQAYTYVSQDALRWMPMKLLEVGAGPGIALDVAQKRGWETWAIEPSTSCARRLVNNGHDVFCGPMEETPSSFSHNFDMLYLYEVLEHQPCPEDFLLRCYELLEPGGIIVIEVPNDYNPLQLQAQKNLGIAPWWLQPPQHLFYFTPKTLQLLVRRAGFDILDMRGTYPLEQFLLAGKNYIGNDTLGRQCHTERMQYELDALRHGHWNELMDTYRSNLATQRIGREIVCLARKPA